MVVRIISLSVGKRLRCGFALSGILLSAGIFGLATAETTESKNPKPVRILLTDDTPDETLSVRRKSADQRNLNKLYSNELRPTKLEPKKVVEADVKPAPPTEEVVTPETLIPKTETPPVIERVEELPQPKSEKNGLDSLSATLTLPKFDVFGKIESTFNAIEDELSSVTKGSESNSAVTNHKSKFKQTYNNRDSEVHAGTGVPASTSIEAGLPTIKLPKLDVFGGVESTFTRIGNELSSVATSAASKNTSEFDSKMKHPGNFTPLHENRAIGAKVHLPTIGSLDGIQFPKIKLSDLNLIFGASTAKSIDENVKIPVPAAEKPKEQTSKPLTVEVEQSENIVKEGGIMALLGLDGLKFSEFNNPFAVGTGIKETGTHVDPVEMKDINPALEENNLEPDETITSELPSLSTERPIVPGIKQIPTLAPKEIPEAPNSLDEQDKSASRVSPYKTLVNPDRFLQQRSAVPVSVRISDSLNR